MFTDPSAGSNIFSVQTAIEAAVAFMGAMSGGLKKVAPPEMQKLWVIAGTVGATFAFIAAKPLVATKEIPIPRVWWIGGAILLVLLAVICLVIYLLSRA